MEEDLDYLHDYYHDSVMEEPYMIDELSIMERLLYQQRELDLMILTRRLEKLQNAENDHTVMKQFVHKQQRLKQFLNEEETRWESRGMNEWHMPGGDFQARLLEEDEEKESSGQRSSME